MIYMNLLNVVNFCHVLREIEKELMYMLQVTQLSQSGRQVASYMVLGVASEF